MVVFSPMKNLMINKNILKENLQAPKQYISNNDGKNINFETFMRNEYKTEAAKYPFLSKTQIKQRVINMWKKQRASQPKLNGRKLRDKSDKTSQQKSAGKGNYKSKNDTEHTPPRHRSKRDLVPLKVDFIPTKDDGILKRNSNSHGEKRRVSFNKKLYIRYRTTSEESSSSTLKDKQNIKQKREPLGNLSNNQPEAYKCYGFNTYTPKQKKSTLDQKFDELLNEKCSWSYKPQKETLNKNMDTQAGNLQPLQATLEVQITEDKCEKALNDMSSRIYMMKCTNDVSAKENINELDDSTLQERNSHQMKTYSNRNRIMKTKFKNINVKLSTSESDKTKTTRISMNEIIESSSSSDEVLQTRYSMNNKTIFPTDEYHSNDCSPIFMERTSDKESIIENNLNTKTSPIIIQATAYNENKDFNDSNSDQILPDVKQKEEIAMNNTNVGIKNRYSLNITTNYSDNTESDSIPIANGKRDEQFDFKEISDGMVKDFMNGSFDITRYQLKKPLVAEQPEKQYMAIMQANTHTQRRKSNNKRAGIKKAKTAPKLSRTVKKSTESLHKKLDNNEANLKVFSKEKGKRIQQEHKTKDMFDNKEADLILKRKIYSPNKTPPKKRHISQKKCKDDSIITESPDRSSTPTRYPKRKLRNSSLAASRKIREIELLENQSDSCEEIIYSNDEINYTSELCKYSNSNNILTGKANELKEKHGTMLNIVENKGQSEIESEENEEANDVSNYFRGEELKNIIPTSYKKTLFQNPLKAFDQSESLSRKDKFKRNFTPDLNSYHKYFTSGTNNDLSGDLKNGFKDKSTNYKNLKDNSYVTNKTEPTNSKNINSFDETKKESKHKTWESLERDLLKELDKMPHVDNICKTVILQEEEVIRKKEVANDTNLLTVSNTSMLQTIRKCIRRNKYNMHYEIENTESKIFESKAKTPHQFRKRVSVPYSSETRPNCKSISILDKTIAAMEKCTENFISPQVNIFDYEQKESNFQFEDATDNSDANNETQFHTSVTFMAKDNKQYYSNEIIGYMKKSKRNSKINFKQSNVTTLVKDLRDEPKEHEDSDYGDSNDAEHSGQSISESKSYLFENHPKESICEVKSQAFVTNSDEKCNPWSILMEKLDVSDNYEDNNEHPIPDSGHTCKTDTKVEKKISEPFMTESNLKQSLKDTYHTDKILISVDDKEKMKIQEQAIKKQGELKEVGYKTVEPLVSEVYRYKSISSEERSSLCETEVSNNIAEEKNIKKDNKHEKNQERKLLKEAETETEINKEPIPKQYEEKILKRSPKYKLRIDRDGSLKIKHSNKSSSVSNSSQDFQESKKISANLLKSHKRSQITNNTRQKYTRYLKRKLDKQALLLTEQKIDGRTTSKSEDEQPKNVSKESKNVSKESKNVSKECENVSRERENVSKESKNVSKERENVFKESKNVSEERENVFKERENVSKAREDVSKEIENASEENPNQDRSNQQLTRLKLIAENDDDIFSLSSSDSETSSKKNPGSGLLCDLFDERKMRRQSKLRNH